MNTHHTLGVRLKFCVDDYHHLIFTTALWRMFYYIDFIHKESEIRLSYYEGTGPNNKTGHLENHALIWIHQESNILFFISISLCWKKGLEFNTFLWSGKSFPWIEMNFKRNGDLSTNVHSSFITIATKWKQCRHLSTGEWMNGIWRIHTME